MALSGRSKRIIICMFLVAFDILVYVALGIALMSYDDSHDDSQSNYGSWGSMTTFDKSASVFLTVWNIINALALAYIIYTVFKRMKFGIQISNK